MRKVLHILLLIVTVTLLSGCDFFRTLAGKPTSAEMARRAAEIEQMEKIKAAKADSIKAKADSVARVQAALVNDSLAVMDALHARKFLLGSSKCVKASSLALLDSRYYVVMGCFDVRWNAENLYLRIEAAGYKPVLINLKNGFTMVATGADNRLSSAFATLSSLRARDFCPRDAWIMEVKK